MYQEQVQFYSPKRTKYILSTKGQSDKNNFLTGKKNCFEATQSRSFHLIVESIQPITSVLVLVSLQFEIDAVV